MNEAEHNKKAPEVEVSSSRVPGDDKAYDVSVKERGQTLKQFRVLTMRNTTRRQLAESEG